MSSPDLTTFKALSFDCYGTLIDWKSGLVKSLSPLTSQLPQDHPYRTNPTAAIVRFNELSENLEEQHPTQLYNDNLVATFQALAAELRVSLPPDPDAIGAAVGGWAAFPDTVDGLQRLARHYRLVILSNVNNDNIRRTVDERLAPVKFDAVYTAQDIGSYKPALGNFRHLFRHAREELGIDREKGELLHVANSLTADHVPAKQLGLRSVWIARGGDKEGASAMGGHRGSLEELTEAGKLGYEWKFATIGEFADFVDRQFAEKEEAK